MALPQRNAAPQAVAADVVNFGLDEFYSGGQIVPDGQYLAMFNVIMHSGFKNKNGPPRLGVMVDFYPLNDCREESKVQSFYSMGTKAHLSFAPNPQTGKGLVVIPGAPAVQMNDKTNWNLFRESLKCGVPDGIFINDLSVLDGIWINVMSVDPPDRSGFGSDMGDNQQDQQKAFKLPIVTEVLDGGKPWEGGGGVPDGTVAIPTYTPPAPPAALAAPAPAAARPTAKLPAQVKPAAAAPVRPAGRKLPGANGAPTPPQAAPAGDDGEASKQVAADEVCNILLKNLNGMPRLSLRAEVFKAVQKKHGDAMASSVIANWMDNETNLTAMLGEQSFAVNGMNVIPLT
jgi:hypothetical protein